MNEYHILMSHKPVASFHKLPIELVYRILDFQSILTLLCSMRNVCKRFNQIIDTYDRYRQVNFIFFNIE